MYKASTSIVRNAKDFYGQNYPLCGREIGLNWESQSIEEIKVHEDSK